MTNWSEAENGTTRKQLAEISGTSEGTIARVETIVTKGTPELKVKYGDVLQRAKENQGTRTDLKPFGDFSKKSESINTREEISKETGVPEWQTRQLFEIIK
jgi:transcriptional regulator with XRE-family HTH domain